MNKICEILLVVKKKMPFKRARDGASLQLLRHDARTVRLHCPISAEIRTGDSQ